MIQKNIPRFIIAALCVVIALGAVSAIAANVSITGGDNLDEQSRAITTNDKKPPQCTMNLTRVVTCTGGNCNGTGQNELILGTSDGETIRGRGGQDCILGGDGDDDIIGNNGGDVCFGGPGADTFTTCETTPDREPGE